MVRSAPLGARLEPSEERFWPSFETRKGALLRMRALCGRVALTSNLLSDVMTRAVQPARDRERPMLYQHILIDEPRPRVRRITLNRPEKPNALNNLLRGEIFDALQAADRDPAVSISILRGAGPCFSAGYD